MVKAFFMLALVLLCGNSLGQNNGAPFSPCPNIFQYIQDQNGGWQGRVTIIPPIQFSEAKLQLKLTVNYFPLSAGVGGITFNGGKQEIQAVSDKATQKERQQINYAVNFPPGKPIPRVAQVVINGKEFCPNIPTYPDTRGAINLSYNLKTGLRMPAVGGNHFAAPDNGNHVAPDVTRPDFVPYIHTSIATKDHADYQQPRPITPSQYDHATAGHPTQYKPAQAAMASPDPHQHYSTAIEPKLSDCLEKCKQRVEKATSSFQGYDSIKCMFDPNRELPDEANVQLWIRDTLELRKSQIRNVKLHRESRLVYITVEKQLVNNIVNKFNGTAMFTSLDGQYIYNVQLSAQLESGIGYRVVRILNLPVEVTERVIIVELNKFGHVYNVTGDRWSDCYYYSVSNGVRIVSMHLDKHIPQRSLLFENHRGVVMYEGQPNPCNCYEKEKLSKGCQNGTESGPRNVNSPSV